jgi:type IV pilus assembly protein PilN
MIRVNLLAVSPGTAPPREWLPREHRAAAVGLTLLLITALGVGSWWWYLHQQHKGVEAKIEAANTELTRLKAVAVLVDRATARRTELSERLALIDRLKAMERGPVDLLETLSRAIPDGLWLLEIKQTGASVQIEGRATSERWITDFAEFLQNSGLFKRPVEIVTTLDEAIEESTVSRFVLKAEAAPPPPAPPATAVTSASPAPPSGAPATTTASPAATGQAPSSSSAAAPQGAGAPSDLPPTAAGPTTPATPPAAAAPPSGTGTNGNSGGSGL